jgi:hypothetical protein
MLSPEDSNHDNISSDIFLNGEIICVPCKGDQEYKLSWDTSTLPLAVDESQLRCSVIRDDKELVFALKRARLFFDEVYPDDPPAGILTVNHDEKKETEENKTTIHITTISYFVCSI